MEEKYNLKNLIITILIVILILIVFYFLTVLIMNHQKDDTVNVDDFEAVIDYDNILVSDIYAQSQDAYYVLVEMPDDEKIASYNTTLNEYSQKTDSLHIYKVDLGSAFNKKYISESTDFTEKYPTFSTTTFLKIEKGIITENYQNDDIELFLETLIGEE